MKKLTLLILTCWLAACDYSENDELTEVNNEKLSNHAEFRLAEVADGIFVHQGVHVEIDHKDHADIPNIGFIIGEQCVAVIDTGGSIKIGEQLLASVREKTSLPICYVINSHVHFDHVLGNAAFKTENPNYVGHVNLEEAIIQNREFFLEKFSADLGENPTVDLIIAPTILVEDVLEIDLGNRKLVLTANPKSHTTTDLTILDVKTNTFWLADLLFMERIPSLDGSLLGWHKLMEGLSQNNYAKVIPGHGPASADWPSAMKPQQQYFEILIKETRQAIAEGVFLGDAINSVAQSEKGHWLLFDNLNQRAVSRAYRELEWE